MSVRRKTDTKTKKIDTTETQYKDDDFTEIIII